MKQWHDTRVLLLLAWVAAASPAVREVVAQDAAMPIKNLRMPLEHYKDGTVKTQLKAAYALVPPDGLILASNVVMEMFFEDGALDSVIKAVDCRYSRDQQHVQSDSAIRIERNGIVISGKGFEWYGEEHRVEICSEARVEFRRDLSRTRDLLERSVTRREEKE